MTSKKPADFKSRRQSLGIALEGLKEVLIAEPNARVHALFTLGVIIAGWMFKLAPLEWAVLFLTVGLVWMAEAFNTALEKLLDLVHPELHPEVKQIKDISAGAVLVSALTALAVGAALFGPRLWNVIIKLFQ